MLLALLMIASPVQDAGTVTADTGPVAQEIVVIGRKLKTWRATIRTGRDGLTCRTKASSGDPEIDALGCSAMMRCWPAARALFDASTAKGLAKADRQRLQAQANETMTTCVAAQHREQIEALAMRRAGPA